jgi:hypothetical protein
MSNTDHFNQLFSSFDEAFYYEGITVNPGSRDPTGREVVRLWSFPTATNTLVVGSMRLTLSFVVAPAICHAFSLRSSFRGIHTLRRQNTAQNDPSQETADQTITMIEKVVAAIEDGNEDKLKNAGLKVSKKSSKELLEDRINNPDVESRVMGALDPEIARVTAEINKTKHEIQAMKNDKFVASVEGVDLKLLSELQAEARKSLLDVEQMDTFKSALFGDEDAGECNMCASNLVEVQEAGVEPVISRGGTGRGGGRGFGVAQELPIKSEPMPTAGLVTAVIDTASLSEPYVTGGSVDEVVVANGGDDGAQADGEEQQGSSSEVSRAVFNQLLKSTMEGQASAAEATDEILIQNTLSSIKEGNVESVDMDAILGDALSTLTKEMGIDVREVLSEEANRSEMQTILGSTMADLAKNIEDLDTESANLNAKLNTLNEDLRRDTVEFENRKRSELEELLYAQSRYEDEFKKSSENLQSSAADLAKVLAEMEQSADPMTAIAMFPIKNQSQKTAFVLGLALAFKVTFDALGLVSIRSADASDLFTLFTQTALCLTLFSHYGLVQAFFRGSSRNQSASS